MFFLRSHSFPNAQSGKLSFRIPQLPVAKPSLVEQFPAVINKFLLHQMIERNDILSGLVLLRLCRFHFLPPLFGHCFCNARRGFASGFCPERLAYFLRFLAGNQHFHRFLPPIHPSLSKSLRLIRSAAWFPLV
jgi:hypothetical protein